MKRFLLLIIFMLISMGQAMAESSEVVKPFRIGAGFGYAFAGYREETSLPLNRYLNTMIFTIDGNIEKGKYFHSFNIGFFTGKVGAAEVGVEDDFYTIYQKEITFTRAYLQYALDYRLWGNETFPGYLGGALRGDIYYNFLVQTVYFSFTGTVALNVHVTQKWIINEKDMLILSAGLPLIGYARRPPYFGFGHDLVAYEEKLISLHNYWAVFGDLKYHHTFNSLLSLYSGLGFEFSRINVPQPRKDILLRVNAGIAFSF